MLDDFYKQYIKENKELLKEDRFEEFFDKVWVNHRSKLAEFFLLDCDINFLEYMTEISDNLFAGSDRLESIKIPNSITNIRPLAFMECRALEEVIIPDSVTVICGSAFRDCDSLKSITIPKSVEYIYDNAFWNTPNLREIKLSRELKDKITLSRIGIFPRKNNVKVILY